MDIFWMVAAVCVVMGVTHACYVFNIVRGTHNTVSDPPGQPVLFVAWTILLWVLLGSYVIILWLISIPLFMFSTLFNRGKT